MNLNWPNQLDAVIYVADADFKLVYMNERAAKQYKNPEELIGKSILDCHKSASAREKIIEVYRKFAAGERQILNYSVKRRTKTIHKVISPLFNGETFSGVFEMMYWES